MTVNAENTSTSRYTNDARVTAYGDGYTVTRDGVAYRVLSTGILGWCVCVGANLDFLRLAEDQFAIGFPDADTAIGVLIGEPR